MQDRLPQTGGHIDQMRELILGPHVRESNRRFEQCETTLRQLGEALRKGLDDVSASLAHQLGNATSSMEKKLKALDLRTGEEVMCLRREMEQLGEKLTARLAKIEDSVGALCLAQEKLSLHVQATADEIGSVGNALRQELAQIDKCAKGELQMLKAQMQDDVNSHSRFVRETRISRDDLAGILVEFAMRIKGPVPMTTVAQLPIPAAGPEDLPPPPVADLEDGAPVLRETSAPGARRSSRSEPTRTRRRRR